MAAAPDHLAGMLKGMPLGRFAWGGQHEKLPKNLRVGSALAPVTYAVIGVFVVSKAGILQVITNEAVLSVGVWVMFAFFAVGTLMNGISRSRPERYIMTPVFYETLQILSNGDYRFDTVANITTTFNAAKGPLIDFLNKHADMREKTFFLEAASQLWPVLMKQASTPSESKTSASAFT